MTTPSDTPDWRSMSQQERDLGLNNGVHVPASADLVAGWDRRSQEKRAQYADHLDLRYGPRERNRIDFFKAADKAPTLLFIHGGYWQTRAKETFALFADGPMAHGINVALTGYTLAPDATLDRDRRPKSTPRSIISPDNCPRSAATASGIVVAGWSAGGHLTSMALSNPHVRAGMAISGIYDLEPIRHSYLNVKLGLDEATSRRNSPMAQAGGATKPLSLVVGDAELPLLRKQTADFAGHRARYGLPVTYEEIPGANHFTIMNEMAVADGADHDADPAVV